MFDDQRVLIAEGDARLRRKLYGMLLDRDIFSDAVANSAAAIDKLRAEEYALVLLDLALPPETADEVMQFVATLPPRRRPFILALATHQDNRGLDVEIVQILLRKPIDLASTADIVQSCLRSTHRREARERAALAETDQEGEGEATSATV
jgi:DNA-binding NtrC family response regulator